MNMNEVSGNRERNYLRVPAWTGMLLLVAFTMLVTVRGLTDADWSWWWASVPLIMYVSLLVTSVAADKANESTR